MVEDQGQGVLAVLLVEVPREGGEKSRLAEELGEEQAAELGRAFAIDSLAALDASGVRRAVAVHPHEAETRAREWLGDGEFIAQRGGTPAERARNVLADAFGLGYGKAMIMVSDAPDMPPSMIQEAASALDSSDSVIGPAVDGGFNILGFRKEAFRDDVLDNVSWGTAMAFADVADNLSGMSIHVLAPWPDIDTANDVRATIRERRNPQFQSSRAMALMREIDSVMK